MYWWVGLITVSLMGFTALGIWFELRPSLTVGILRCHLKKLLGVNLLTFVAAEIGLLFGAVQTVMAAPAAAAVRSPV